MDVADLSGGQISWAGVVAKVACAYVIGILFRIDGPEALEGVKADDLAGVIDRLEDRAELRKREQSPAAEDAAFDDRAVDVDDLLEDFVSDEESRKRLAGHVLREVLDLVNGRVATGLEILRGLAELAQVVLALVLGLAAERDGAHDSDVPDLDR